jgi:hypothetical protein
MSGPDTSPATPHHEPSLFTLPAPPPTADPVQVVFEHWLHVLRTGRPGITPQLSPERRRKIAAAIALYGSDICCAAIDGCTKSPFHMGANPRQRRYDDISLILRDAKHIEMFADLAATTSAVDDFLADDTTQP